jgi:cytoskeletal protein CcmA (bactofilin family)
MPSITRKRTKQTAVKNVICTHCERVTEVAQRAMSVFCPHCKKRLVLEDFKITSYHGVREFATCGDVVIEKRGHVSASVKANTLVVKGKMQGAVVARSSVAIHKTANCQGDIESPTIKVESGATVNGFLRIGPADDGHGDSTAMPVAEATTPADEDAASEEKAVEKKTTRKKVVRKKTTRKKKIAKK